MLEHRHVRAHAHSSKEESMIGSVWRWSLAAHPETLPGPSTSTNLGRTCNIHTECCRPHARSTCCLSAFRSHTATVNAAVSVRSCSALGMLAASNVSVCRVQYWHAVVLVAALSDRRRRSSVTRIAVSVLGFVDAEGDSDRAMVMGCWWC
jgi:hypothetical protein